MLKPLLFFVALLVQVTVARAQGCPANIGFENGNLDNWTVKTGVIGRSGTITYLAPSYSSVLIHRSNTNDVDYFGGFPVTAPNGSNYSVQLGNGVGGSQVDELSYVFDVPVDNELFTIIFNYAIVLENPTHSSAEQPRFTVKVFNETRNQYIECSSFDFVAGFSQPDFIESTKKPDVFYKPWSSVSVNLGQYRGERLRLEFVAYDCIPGAHFGYAYIDVMERCTSGLTGYVLCKGDNHTTLYAPSGFAGYEWYTGNFSQHLASTPSYYMTNPQVGDSLALVLLPAGYLGCKDTIMVEFVSIEDSVILHYPDTLRGCKTSGINLTNPQLTTGSSNNLLYEYFLDSLFHENISRPNQLIDAGKYYIRGTSIDGCDAAKPFVVELYDDPEFIVTQPQPADYATGVNLTRLTGNNQLSYSYFMDPQLTQAVPRPTEVKQSGTYYIKGTNQYQCYSVETVQVKINALLFVPNAFTPNADGKNDEFRYTVFGGLQSVEYFSIYNRWGQLVFTTKEPNKGWNGKINDMPAPPGTYIWMLKGNDWEGKTYNSKGTVILIR